MKRFLWLSLIVLFLAPLGAWSAVPTKSASRAELRRKIDGFVMEARKSANVREWIASTRLLSRLDKASLLVLPNLPEKMPEIKRRFNDSELVITIDGITADFANAGKGELILNGEKIHIDERATLADTFQRIDRQLEKKNYALRLLPAWVSPPPAQAEALQLTCLESKFEFMARSPTALLESNFGYIGKLFVSGVVVASVNIVSNVLAHCDSQVEEMQQILKDGNIGIKAIDCGSDGTGFDRSIEFWIPERDEKGKFKTRTFNLDYTLLMAQEAKKEKDEEEEEEVPPKKRHERGGELYIFGNTDLHEVRAEKINPATNKYECHNAYPGTERFDRYKDDIEPFRKIFQYVGEFNSCSSCNNKMLRNLRSPEAPTYFPPPPPAVLGTPPKGTISIVEKKAKSPAAKKKRAKHSFEPAEKSHKSAE